MNEQPIIFMLVLVCLVLSVIIAVMALTIPFLWWQVSKLEKNVAVLDEVVAGISAAAGIPKDRASHP